MTNILIVGVGGQGTLLASRILGNLAVLQGDDCKLSEVHGMAQRGGSVVTHVKIAKVVDAPIIAEGEADVVIAFEALEASRWIHYLKKDGILIVNSQQILPMPVITGAREYPDQIIQKMKDRGINVIDFDALKIAEELGNTKAVNVIMLGVLAKKFKMNYEDMKKALAMTVKPQFLELNYKALDKGYNI